MFNGEESVRIRSDLSREELEDIVADAFDRLGSVRFTRSGRFRVETRRFDNTFALVQLEGKLTAGRKDGQWRLTVSYKVELTPLCIAIVIFGALICLFGLLVLLGPHDASQRAQRAVRRTLRDARDDIEDEEEREEAAHG